MTFYLKYRSQNISDLDLPEVRESLQEMAKSGKIPQAFLFAGPKGTGKTSAARIIAKVVNCEHPLKGGEPCNRCDQCVSITKGTNIDVVELDAASHRGIDDVRALKDAVKLAPAGARKKVYIIDEAHMLTTEASNALLKTLEEPPQHCIFILATTNPEKLLPTIRSRTLNIMFRKAKEEEILMALGRVIDSEKIKISKEDLATLIKSAGGSFRDAVKLLEQYTVEGKVLSETDFDIEDFITLLSTRKTRECLEKIAVYMAKGGEAKDLGENLLRRLRLGLLYKVGVDGSDIPALTKNNLIDLINLISKAVTEIKTAVIEELPLELAIVEWNKDEDTRSKETVNSPDIVDSPKTEVSDEMWKSILAKMRPINTSIEALLRAARPLTLKNDILELGVYYKFHKERLEDGKIRKVFEDVVKTVMGIPIRVKCTLTDPPVKKITLTTTADKDIIKAAEEIFSS